MCVKLVKNKTSGFPFFCRPVNFTINFFNLTWVLLLWPPLAAGGEFWVSCVMALSGKGERNGIIGGPAGSIKRMKISEARDLHIETRWKTRNDIYSTNEEEIDFLYIELERLYIGIYFKQPYLKILWLAYNYPGSTNSKSRTFSQLSITVK